MKALAITHKGIEDVCAQEILDIVNADKNNINKKDIKTNDSVVIFDFKDLKDLCKLCYQSQSAIKILFFFDAFDIDTKDLSKTLDIINPKIKKIDFSQWMDKENTFMVSCKRVGEHGFNSRDV